MDGRGVGLPFGGPGLAAIAGIAEDRRPVCCLPALANRHRWDTISTRVRSVAQVGDGQALESVDASYFRQAGGLMGGGLVSWW